MNGDDEVKTQNLNLRVSSGELENVKAMANAMTAGDVSNLQRQLFKALAVAIEKHGERVKWPPELNFYPPETKTQQDLDSSLHLEG